MRASQRITLVLVILANVAVVAAIVCLAPRMAPIQPGNSGEFWYQVCRAQLGDQPIEHFIGQVVLDDGWFIYEMPHMHGSWLFQVCESEAMTDFPRVLDQMDARADDAEKEDYVTRGFRAWKDDPNRRKLGTTELINSIDRALTEHLHELHDTEHQDSRAYHRFVMGMRLQKANRYWANLAFEIVFLCGWVWFVAWPIWKQLSARRLALHWLLAPVMFMLPTYLGYATYTFTSVGPSGGVLYPWLLSPLRGGRQLKLENRILSERLPPLLESLSQDTGEPMVISGTGMWGPLEMLIFGAIIGPVAYALGRWAFRLPTARSNQLADATPRES